jgi:hypothetical protein
MPVSVRKRHVSGTLDEMCSRAANPTSGQVLTAGAGVATVVGALILPPCKPATPGLILLLNRKLVNPAVDCADAAGGADVLLQRQER